MQCVSESPVFSMVSAFPLQYMQSYLRSDNNADL